MRYAMELCEMNLSPGSHPLPPSTRSGRASHSAAVGSPLWVVLLGPLDMHCTQRQHPQHFFCSRVSAPLPPSKIPNDAWLSIPGFVSEKLGGRGLKTIRFKVLPREGALPLHLFG